MIAVKVFNVKIEEIPNPAISIQFEAYVIPLILLLTTIYLLISFCVHVFDDFLNKESASFMVKSEEIIETLNDLDEKFKNWLDKFMNEIYGENVSTEDILRLRSGIKEAAFSKGDDDIEIFESILPIFQNLDGNYIKDVSGYDNEWTRIVSSVLNHKQKRTTISSVDKSRHIEMYGVFAISRIVLLEIGLPVSLGIISFFTYGNENFVNLIRELLLL